MPEDSAAHRLPSTQLIKVPARITVLFWVIKLLTTGTGEAASDYLGTVPLVLAGLVAVGGFGASLWWQFRMASYRPAVYWLAVTMVAVFGTVAADGVHVGLGVPYAVSTLFWAVVVAAVLGWWYRSEGSLSIHSVTTARRERFYWTTVLATFALGTAAGDLTASELRLGFFPSAVLFGVLILVPLIAWRLGWIGDVTGFWAAYVLTRPLGASFADWFGKPHRIGHGLGFGDGTVAAVGLVAIAVLVGASEWAFLNSRSTTETSALDADGQPEPAVS
ncbi:hypothetical protein [uncultured Jatrophihabitans sp.]|uniref:COG4705 family protein n=1 Tax=uncultured Jatrophihabitans sp. TaxID=1610747 RepID=UPI0035CB270D